MSCWKTEHYHCFPRATQAPSPPSNTLHDGVIFIPCLRADPPLFRQVSAPEQNNLQALVEQIAARVGEALERSGLIERDIEHALLSSGAEPGPLDDLIGHSITYRTAVGRSCSRCRPFSRGCRGPKATRTGRPAQAGSTHASGRVELERGLVYRRSGGALNFLSAHTTGDTIDTFKWPYYLQVTKTLGSLAAHQAQINPWTTHSARRPDDTR